MVGERNLLYVGEGEMVKGAKGGLRYRQESLPEAVGIVIMDKDEQIRARKLLFGAVESGQNRSGSAKGGL